jgi:predicted RNA-binding Zn ribbon-like protein
MSEPEFLLLGDAIWLDFVNTARGRTVPPVDRLPDTAAYQRWLTALLLRPDAEDRSFGEVVRVRSGLTALAAALDHGERPPAPAISIINDLLRQSEGAEQLTRAGGDWRLQFAPGAPAPALVAVARSAALTLADPLMLVRQCAGADCSLFFTDDSVAQGRRCCSPDICGRTARIERRRGLLR